MRELSLYETKQIKVGEGLTVSAVMTILITAVIAVIVYRLFLSSSAKVTIPGGFKFEW